MIDLVKIKVKAGNGGNGAVSFYKLINMRYGKPDGGDGGPGGNIFIEATDSLFDLEVFRGKNIWEAGNGGNGGRNQKRGKDGEDIVIKVPAGTILNLKINKPNDKQELPEKPKRRKKTEFINYSSIYKTQQEFTFDLKEKGQKILVASGGHGGKGNMHAVGKRDLKGKKADHWGPFNRAEKGREGELVDVSLELKTIAQVGIIGLPNAGKSTFLASVTNAKPKIADYPFTTLEPNLGIMDGVILADIPGIISGAAKGKGLGLTFLKHIERTNLLLHIISAVEEDIYGNYQIIRDELKYYGNDLEKKKEIIVINKTDLIDKEQEKKIKKLFAKKKIFFISAQNCVGLEELKQNILQAI